MAAGADYWMHKPIMPDEMVQHIKECIQTRRQQVN
jgi:DNA-binding response OmpR family regulator